MTKKQPLRYFYLDVADHGLLLHKKLQINRGRDTLVAWCYPLHKRVAYTYSTVLRNKQPAFGTSEVAAMIGRSTRSMEKALLNGHIDPPQFVYNWNSPEQARKFLWSEPDIMKVHDYFSSVHYGRPRKDGMINPMAMPTKREVRAMIHQEPALYVMGKDGEFVPTWKANDFS